MSRACYALCTYVCNSTSTTNNNAAKAIMRCFLLDSCAIKNLLKDLQILLSLVHNKRRKVQKCTNPHCLRLRFWFVYLKFWWLLHGTANWKPVYWFINPRFFLKNVDFWFVYMDHFKLLYLLHEVEFWKENYIFVFVKDSFQPCKIQSFSTRR